MWSFKQGYVATSGIAQCYCADLATADLAPMRTWYQIQVIVDHRCENELLTRFLAPTAPTNLRLRRSVRVVNCPSRLNKEKGCHMFWGGFFDINGGAKVFSRMLLDLFPSD